MAGGVELHSIQVENPQLGTTELTIRVSIAAENEFEAIGWLIDALGKDV